MTKSKFYDGVVSFVSSLVNSRNPSAQNTMYSTVLSDETKRQIYRSGIGNKIVRIKAGHALKNTIQFESAEDEKFYSARLAQQVKDVAKWMMAFGRGVIVLHHKGDDLSKPLGEVRQDDVMIRVFSGDMISTGVVELDLNSERYMKPAVYVIRGHNIHYSRVIDYTYVKPTEMDAPMFRYGGISEFDLVHEQIIADGIVQRASPRIIEKASSMFYKVRGFKDAMRSGQETDMVNYFSNMENIRGIFAAGLIDQEDELEVISQNISNLAEADQITLRRLAMVTSIPLAMLVGENVKGLNSTGDNERQVFQDTIEALQSDYLLDPINELMRKLGQGVIAFKENQGDTPATRIEFEAKAITNATALNAMGEDYQSYLEEKGILQKDEFDLMFGEVDDQAAFVDEFKEEEHKRDGEKFAKKEGAETEEAKPSASKQKQNEPSKATASPQPSEKKQAAEKEKAARFEKSLESKTPEDASAFRAAKADGIAIPPAWTGVVYHGKEGKDGIIAQGKDSKGRSQRVEVAAFREAKIAEKQARIAQNLAPRMGKITEDLKTQAALGNEQAKVLYLITQTGFRIGGEGDGKAKEQAFGASTLMGDHVKVEGDTVHFDFPGKKGVRQQHSVTDPTIAKMFANAKLGEKVFNTNDAKVSSEWKKHGGEKVHDIRSHVATTTARKAMLELIPPKPKNAKEMAHLEIEVAKIASRKLGNNPDEALKTYINHDIFREAA